MKNPLSDLGRNIQYIRKKKNLTQESLAEKCDLHTSYLAGVERGTRNITIQTLLKITEGLEVNPEVVFNISLLDNTIDDSNLINAINNKLVLRSTEELNLINNIIDAIINRIEN